MAPYATYCGGRACRKPAQTCWTGGGYDESPFLDPEGNRLGLTI